MTETLLNAGTLLSQPNAAGAKAALAIANRENGRPLPLLYSYWADTPNNALLAPPYWSSGQQAINVTQTSGGWCVTNGLLTSQALPVGGTVSYLSSGNLGGLVTRVGGRFQFSSTDPNGVAAIIICSGIINPSGVMPNMSCHLHCSPYNWTFGIWQGSALGGGGETVLGSGSFSFAAGMDINSFYEMECVIQGTTATIRLPDGNIKSYTNSLIATYGGNYAVLENYTTGATNSVPKWSHFWADTGTPQLSAPGWMRAVDGVMNGTLSVANLEVTGPNSPVYGDVAMCTTGLGVMGWVPPSTIGTTTATATTLAARDASGNVTVVNCVEGLTSTATAGGTTVLTVASNRTQVFTGTLAQTVTMPVTSTLGVGQQWLFVNSSTGAVTIQSSGANTIVVLAGGTAAFVTCDLASGTTAASWDSRYLGVIVASGKALTVSNSLTLAGTDATTMTFPSSSDTVATLGATQTFTSKTINAASNTITLATSNLAGLVPYDLSIAAFAKGTTRAAGTGDFPFGVKLQRAVTFTSVTYRANTADASGNLVVKLQKNASDTGMSGSSVTIAAASQVAGGTGTGTWSFSAGDILTVSVVSVGTTPGTGLIADITGLA